MADVKYSILETPMFQIIIREFYGEVKVDDVTNSFEYIMRNYCDNDIRGIITDFSHADFSISMEKFKSVLEYIEQNPGIFKMRLAVIVNTPEKTIFPILAQAKLEELLVKPFSTREAAIDWMIEN